MHYPTDFFAKDFMYYFFLCCYYFRCRSHDCYTTNVRLNNMNLVSGWCQDGYTSSRTITEVKLSLAQPVSRWVKLSGEWWVQFRHEANMVAQGDGKFGPWGWPQDPSKPIKQTKKNMNFTSVSNTWRTCCFTCCFTCSEKRPVGLL